MWYICLNVLKKKKDVGKCCSVGLSKRAPWFILSVYLYTVRVCVQEASFRLLAGGVLTYFWPWT